MYLKSAKLVTQMVDGDFWNHQIDLRQQQRYGGQAVYEEQLWEGEDG